MDAATTTTAPALSITVEFIEGSCERHDATRGRTYNITAFEALLREVAKDAPAGGAYDKCAIKLSWAAARLSSLAPVGSALELAVRLDVKRDFGTLRDALSLRTSHFRGIAQTGRLANGSECTWMNYEQADAAASLYEEALEAYDAA